MNPVVLKQLSGCGTRPNPQLV